MSNAMGYQAMKLLLTIEEPGRLCNAVISPDGQRFVVNQYFPMKVRSTETGELIYTLYPDELAYSLAISRDGQMLAAGCKDVSTTLWNLKTGEKINRLHTTTEFPCEVNCVGFTPDNKILLAGWGSKTEFWNLETGYSNMWRTFFGNDFVISEDGKTILCRHISTLKITEFSSGHCLHNLRLDYLRCIAMNQDSSKFATGSEEGAVTIFNTSTAEEIITWKAHSSNVRGVIFCPDNQTIISSGKDKLIHFWNINTGEKIHTLTEQPYGINSISLSADGRTLVSASSCPSLREDLSSVISIWGIR